MQGMLAVRSAPSGSPAWPVIRDYPFGLPRTTSWLVCRVAVPRFGKTSLARRLKLACSPSCIVLLDGLPRRQFAIVRNIGAQLQARDAYAARR